MRTGLKCAASLNRAPKFCDIREAEAESVGHLEEKEIVRIIKIWIIRGEGGMCKLNLPMEEQRRRTVLLAAEVGLE
jgi:hypothetical protein